MDTEKVRVNLTVNELTERGIGFTEKDGLLIISFFYSDRYQEKTFTREQAQDFLVPILEFLAKLGGEAKKNEVESIERKSGGHGPLPPL